MVECLLGENKILVKGVAIGGKLWEFDVKEGERS
jgi:hypothetical protein